MLSQPPLGVDCGRTAGAGRGDGLPIGSVNQVAGREDPVHRRRGASGTAAISQGALFRVEAVAAVAAALLVLVTRGWPGLLVAFLVAAGGVGAVLLYQYVDLGALGPFPDMYEPGTYPEKTFSLVAEAVAALAALALLLTDLRRHRARHDPVGA